MAGTINRLTFSHAVGYRGECVLRGQYFLCTGGSITLSQDPIMGTGVWGAGYGVASPLAYAWNYLSVQGSANFELTNAGQQWTNLKSFVNTDRTTASSIKLYPDGTNGFNGSGWFTQCSFQASQGAAVTGSFGFKGDPSNGGMNVGSSATARAEAIAAGKVFAGAKLIPYWSTTVDVGSNVDASDIINWNCSGNSDLQMLRCCSSLNTTNQGSSPIRADYVLCGQISADASFTVFTLKGQFNPAKYHAPITDAKFYMKQNYVQIPKLIINNASTSMTTGASYVTAEFSYNALGDGTNAIFELK